MWQRKPSLLLFHQKKIDTFNKTEKSQEPNKTVDIPRINKTNKAK